MNIENFEMYNEVLAELKEQKKMLERISDAISSIAMNIIDIKYKQSNMESMNIKLQYIQEKLYSLEQMIFNRQ